jgi:hypothetical protein
MPYEEAYILICEYMRIAYNDMLCVNDIVVGRKETGAVCKRTLLFKRGVCVLIIQVIQYNFVLLQFTATTLRTDAFV